MKDYELPDEFSLDQFFGPVDRATWRQQVDAGLRGASFEDKLVTTTEEGIRLQPLYGPADQIGPDASGFPGFLPYVRGPALGGGWQTRQVCSLPNVRDANAAVLDELERGSDGVELELSVDGGGPGTAIRTMIELEHLLSGVDLRHAPIGLRAGADFFVLSAAFMELVEKRGVHAEQVRADLGCDPYGALARTGRLRTSLSHALEQIAELSAVTHAQYPKVRVFTADAGPWHDAGAGDAQSVGIALAGAIEVLRALEERGLSLQDHCARIVFRIPLGTEIFGGIALLRAVRLLWSEVQEACGLEQPCPAVIHAEPAQRVLTRRDPWVNMLRNTVVCFAGAVGGANIVTTLPFDTTLGEPGEHGRRIARNTQNVLRLESNLDQVADPGGGSWFIESLTRQLAERAWTTLQEIERRGGLSAALMAGAIAELISQPTAQRAARVATRRRPITGVSQFANLNEESPVPDPPSPCTEMPAPAPVPGIGPGVAVARLMDAIGDGAARLDALAEGLSSDEIRIAPLPLRPLAAPFESLRDRADDVGQPAVYLANLGPLAEHNSRAGFARNLLAAGGIDAVDGQGFTDVNLLAGDFFEADTPVAIICGSNERYAKLAADAAAALVSAGAERVLLAGRPEQIGEEWSSLDVSGYLHLGCDVLEVLETIWTALEQDQSADSEGAS